MTSDKLFKNYYEPKLIENNIENVVLRVYSHTQGSSTDDPSNSTELVFTPRKEVDARLDDIFKVTSEDKGIAITSIISHNTEQKYLFLLDCAVKVNDENELELLGILRKSTDNMLALKNSMLLRTKNSYHVVSFMPLSKEEWLSHMSEAILLCNSQKQHIADIRYVGHSLERGYGSLRISDYKDKPTPDFVCYIT